MMNKKAIAAFAAGATLLAGFAMATPAFAKDEAKGSKTEESKPADAAKIAELKKAVKDADKKATLAGYAVDDAQAAYNKAKAQSQAEEAVVKQYNETLKKVKAAKKAKTTADTGNDDALKAQTALDYINAQKAHDASKKAVEDYNAALTDASLNAYRVDVANIKAGAAVDENSVELAYTAAKRGDLLEAKAKKADADNELQAAKDALAKAEGKDTPVEPKHETTQDPTTTPSTKAGWIGLVSSDKVALDEAKADKADKLKTYNEKFTVLANADAALSAAKANYKAAHQRVVDAHAEGLDVSNPTAYKDLVDAENRAAAAQAAAQADFDKANLEFNKAKAKAEKASDTYNKALEKYKKDYNAALAAGVKLPADLPQITDPLVPTTLPGVPGVVTPVPGQPGKPGKPEVEKKKNDGKKLPGTGVGVTLTALAATMLAGMGAAVRKARH